jgi:protein TonB
MHRLFAFVSIVLLALVSVTGCLRAQEPAFFSGTQAVRFEQNPGYFHFVYPCKSIAEYQAQMPKPDPFATGLEPAICWPVNALKMVKVNGKFESSPFVAGQLIVAEHNIRFIPSELKLTDRYFDIKPTEARFEHEAGKNFAFFGNNDVFYKFSFATVCPACTPGSSVPVTSNPAQLEHEFSLVNASFKQFDAALKSVRDLAAPLRIEIGPKNQPGPGDPPEAMGLYGSLDSSLAQGAGCGQPPACTAACALSPDSLHNVQATFCIQPDQQGATPIPDWSDVLRKKNASEQNGSLSTAPEAQSGTGQIPMAAGPLPIRPFRPGTVDPQFAVTSSSPPSVGCTVKASYLRASIPAFGGGFGVAGMNAIGTGGGVAGGVIGSATLEPNAVPGAPRKIAIASGVASSLLIQQVSPVYPPIAKAARISGTVKLQATISKEGSIENLHVISGHPMLQSAALDAVRQWKYRPYLVNGEPVNVDTTINVVFSLGGAPAPPGAQAPAQR